MSGGLQNITISKVHFKSADGAAHIKTGQSRGGYVTDVLFEDLTFSDGAELAEGILVDAHYGSVNPSCPAGWKPAAPPLMRGYTFRRIAGERTVVKSDPCGHRTREVHL